MKHLFMFFLSITMCSCSQKATNHIDKYNINAEELKTLPDNFYSYRRGTVRITSPEYIVWFDLNKHGNIGNVLRIGRPGDDMGISIRQYNIDTTNAKETAQHFINLSRKYRFGHINVDRKNKIAFSSRDGLAEQYVLPMNDSIRNVYMTNPDFSMLSNGWFENKEPASR